MHLCVAALVLFGVSRQSRQLNEAASYRARVLPPGIIWVNGGPGPARGGGGSGKGMQAPPRRAEMPGHDAMTVPVGKAPQLVFTPPATRDLPPPEIQQLDIAALAQSRGTEAVVGTLDGVPGGNSLGPGAGGRAGAGNGSGNGNGVGPGLGDGANGGFGGDLFRPGSGVQDPEPVYTPKPEYTADAMERKIQGTAVVQCIVRSDGSVTNPHIVQSLDSRYGLDAQALKAAGNWRFVPARYRGQPVPMLVEIRLTFSLR